MTFPFPFFIPAAAAGGNDSYTKVLLHLDGADGSTTITDNNAGGSAHAWTNNGATGAISIAQSKFGGASYSTGGGSGWVDTPDHADYTLGSGDWTVDFWAYPLGFGSARFLVGQANSAATGISFDILRNASNVFTGEAYIGGVATSVIGTTAISTSGWHHVAFTRNGSVLRLFVDGIQEGGNVAISGAVDDSASPLAVGRLGAYASLLWYGYIDEFRLSVGIARWTTSFTPPLAAYTP
jgi:hypothetical protein